MILLCDEDIGTSVPRALRLVGLNTQSMYNLGWLGRKDPEWLPIAGAKKWLVFSANYRMLRVPHEKELIIRYEVGIVYLTSGVEHPVDVLRLLLVKWRWLEGIDRTLERPFARFVSRAGRVSESYRGLSL
ncbi:MAG: hypothetical protein HY691_01875 [Chloroflexi bacterium]|nr:hypothetical protein [Chloroflexota bacterium]